MARDKAATVAVLVVALVAVLLPCAQALQLYCRCECLGETTNIPVGSCSACQLDTLCMPEVGPRCTPSSAENEFVQASCFSGGGAKEDFFIGLYIALIGLLVLVYPIHKKIESFWETAVAARVRRWTA